MFHLRDHGLDGDHRVIDEQPQRDDQRPQRDALQVDPEDLHDDEHDGQHQRDRGRHDQARPQAQIQEADDEHDRDGLPKRLHEFVNRFFHHLRLIGDQESLDADGQVRFELLDHVIQILFQSEDVAAGAHRERHADGVLAVDAELRLRRVGVAARDRRDVAEAQHLAAEDEIDLLQVLFGFKPSGHIHEHGLILRLDHAGGDHGVLGHERLDQLHAVHAEFGQAVRGELDIDPLVLGAQEFGFGDIFHSQQARARLFRVIAQFPVTEAVRREAIDDPVGVAEFVVEKRPHDSLRERLPDIADFLADLVPEVRHILLRGGLEQIDKDGGRPGDGIALQIVKIGRVLQLLLDAIGHLLHGLVLGRARPERLRPPSF